MSSEWPIVKLGTLADFQEGYVNPSQRDSSYFDGPIKWLRATDLNDSVVTNTTRTLSDKGFKSAGKSAQLFEPGTLAISKSGTIGRLGMLGDYMCGNRAVINIKPKQNAVPRYLFFVLRHLRPTIETLAEGSVQKNLYVSTLSNLDVPAPPRDVQQSFADTLGALDDRITLLRETNATLEAIAQALFKSWFVDFDPVRAKMEGRTPEGMDEATAALFPDGFETSELGEVPRGWRVAKVGEVAEVVKGKSYSSKDLVDSHHTALVTLKSFERGGGFRMDGFKPYSGAYKPSQVVSAGDLIVAYTDVTQAAELIGKPAVVVGVDEYATLVASLDVGIVRPDERHCGKQFLYGLFRTDAFQSHTLAHTSGTTVLHLAKDGIGSFAFALPPNELIRSFEVTAAAIASRKQTNSDAVRTLSTLRDTLLPRLISGQLRLPEAQAATEAALGGAL